MKIHSPAENRITVDLTEQDMAELDITYEEMDYSTIETRRVIWTLLDEAGKALGKELDPSRRMIIEAIPKSEGGCVLNFTLLDAKKYTGSRRQMLKKQSEIIACDFSSLDNLYLAAASCSFYAESSLYESGGKYRLIISGTDNRESTVRYFSEFGRVTECSSLTYEYMKEHWRLLAEGNALHLLRN